MTKYTLSIVVAVLLSACADERVCVKSHKEEYTYTSRPPGPCIKFTGGIGFSVVDPFCGSGLGIPLMPLQEHKGVRTVCDEWTNG